MSKIPTSHVVSGIVVRVAGQLHIVPPSPLHQDLGEGQVRIMKIQMQHAMRIGIFVLIFFIAFFVTQQFFDPRDHFWINFSLSGLFATVGLLLLMKSNIK